MKTQGKPPKTLVCKECGLTVIPKFHNYLENNKDGTILCEGCFKKLKKEGKL